jgi:hypothetical protein
MQCDFCSERLYLGGGYRVRPTAEVIEDIQHTGAKSIFFGDSDFGGKRARDGIDGSDGSFEGALVGAVDFELV